MRLKQFIIFIIIFTILYFSLFAIYDHFSNKKNLKKLEESKKNLLSIKHYYFFASFYNINSSITEEVLKLIYKDLTDNLIVNLSAFNDKYNVSKEEAIVIILFLEYLELIKRRVISYERDTASPLTEYDNSLVVKYTLYFMNKYDYNTIVGRVGINSDKELAYINSKYLVPGVRIIDKVVYYVGDYHE